MVVKKNKSNNKAKYIVITIVLILFSAALLKVYEDVFSGNINVEPKTEDYLYIYSTKSLAQNMQLIEESGKLNNTRAFERLATLTGYDELIKPGRYKISYGMSNLQLLRTLVSGRQTPLDITFKYAQYKNDVSSFFCTKLEADSFELLAKLNDSSYCSQLGFSVDDVIAMFIPNTYNFYWTTSADDLLKRMNSEYTKFWQPDKLAKLDNIGLTKQQVSTLAAIVQKETYRKDEMPIVAGVYLNRIKKGMPLQADPTIIYALHDNNIKRVSGEMLMVESPYNTYKYKGLPPGPICTPSLISLEAVLNATNHNYIYFCAKEDFSGYHNFAINFAQHQLNARKYQRELNKRGIK